MATLQYDGSSLDLVLASDRALGGSTSGSYVDPDAVLLPDGTVRVMCSGRIKPDGSEPYAVLVKVAGDADDACADWMDAWPSTA